VGRAVANTFLYGTAAPLTLCYGYFAPVESAFSLPSGARMADYPPLFPFGRGVLFVFDFIPLFVYIPCIPLVPLLTPPLMHAERPCPGNFIPAFSSCRRPSVCREWDTPDFFSVKIFLRLVTPRRFISPPLFPSKKFPSPPLKTEAVL